MNEQTRTPQERHGAPGGGSAFFETPSADASLVLVQAGVHSPWLPVANFTVAEIRRRFRDRLDIDPQSQAFVNGQPVSDDTVMRAGEVLSFTRLAGAKGTGPGLSEELYALLRDIELVLWEPESPPPPPPARKNGRGAEVIIRGTMACARLPEGLEARLPVEELFGQAAGPVLDTGGVVLPDGVRLLQTRGSTTILVWESPPQVRTLRWVANPPNGQPGSGSRRYRHVCLALPYLILVAGFGRRPDGRLVLTRGAQCFFRTAPLQTVEDALCYPALLNCMRPRVDGGLAFAEICLQYFQPTPDMGAADPNRALRAMLQGLIRELLDTGFNYEGDNSFLVSGYSLSRHVDPRIETVEAWEAATQKNPLFVLDVPWLPIGQSLRQVMENLFRREEADTRPPRDAEAVARLVFHHAHVHQPELPLHPV